jgi:flagellar hook-associated protein 2
MAITSIGVGSGLPLDQLLTNLRNSENQALSVIQTRVKKEQDRLSAYGSLKSGLEDLKTMAETLQKPETYAALKTSVTGDAFTATTSTGSIAGSYRIGVSQLASAQSLKSSTGQADRTTALADGNVTLEVELVDGTKTTLTLAAEDTSLDGIVAALNGDSGVGVSATLVNSGEATNPYYLLLNARGTGEQAAVKSITVAGVDPATDVTSLTNTIGFTQGGAGALVETAAKNANLTVNGISVSSQTNTVSTAIDGVTLNLASETTSDQTLSLTSDPSSTRKAITTFISTYNNLQAKISSFTAYDTENQKASALTGDSMARRIQSQMRDALTSIASSGAFRSLGEIGISIDPDKGIMSVDDAKLDDVLANRMVDVKALFSSAGGLGERVATAADAYVKDNGLLKTASDGVNATLSSLQDQYDSTSARIDARMATYQQQFSQLDGLIAQMNSTSTYLTQQLSMLSKLSQGNNSSN